MRRTLILAISVATVLGVMAASAAEANDSLRAGAQAQPARGDGDSGNENAIQSNEKAIRAVPQRPSPKLFVSSIATKPIVGGKLAQGATLDVDVRVQNAGTLASAPTQKVLITCTVKSGGPVCPLAATDTRDLGKLDAGDSASVIIYGATPAQPGTYEIKGQPVGYPASSAGTTLVVVGPTTSLQGKSALTPVIPLEPRTAKGLKITPAAVSTSR